MTSLILSFVMPLPALTDLKTLAELLGSPLPTFESKVTPRVSRFAAGTVTYTVDYDSVPLVRGRVYPLESNFDHMFRGRDSSYDGILTTGSSKFLVGRPTVPKQEIKPGIVDFREEAVSDASLLALVVDYSYTNGKGVKKANYQSSWYRWGDWRTKFQFSGQTYLRTTFSGKFQPSITSLSGTGANRSVATPVIAIGRVLAGTEALFVLEQIDPAGASLLTWRQSDDSYTWNSRCRIDDWVITKVILRHSSLLGWFINEPGMLSPLSSTERLYAMSNLGLDGAGNQFRASGDHVASPNSIPGGVTGTQLKVQL